jgi:hypothetical protein
MPLDEHNVPLPPDNDGNEDVLTSQSTNRSTRRPATRAATTHHCPRPARTGRHHGACPARHPGAAVIAR